MQEQHQPQYLSIAEVAARYRVSSDTIRRRISDGSLPAVKVGKMYRIRREDAEAFGKQPAA